MKKKEVLAILTHISRGNMDREALLQALGADIPELDRFLEQLLQDEMIVSIDGVFSVTEKGLKKPHHRRPGHQKETGGRKQGKRRGLIQIAVLQLLKEQPRHGYEIMKLLEERSEGVYSPSAGTIYPALQDLSERDLISIEEQVDKKVYRLTELGLQFLTEMVQDEDNVFWEEWRLHLLWKQSKEAILLKEEMEKLQLEFQYASRKVLQNPALAGELAEIMKEGRARLIEWSKNK